MLRIFLFALFTIVLLPQLLLAKTHVVPFNVATTLNLSDGDEIVLSDGPIDWGYNRVSIGVNSSPYATLSGSLVVNNCRYRLRDYYKEVRFYLSDSASIVYYGPDAVLPVQWWLDYGYVPAECEDLDSIAGVNERCSFLDLSVKAIFDYRLKDYTDLGPLNTNHVFRGVSGRFKISSMPSWKFNVLKIRLEPLDGKKLDGYVYFGEKRVKVGGNSSIITVGPRLRDIFFFEVVFSSYRKVKMSWWAEQETPAQKVIDVTSEESGDSVSVVYEFERTPYTWRPLEISFDKDAFTDGRYPMVSKYAFLPNGPSDSVGLGLHGSLYDISANIRQGKEVVMALPLEMAYDAETDTLWFERFLENENRWEGVPVDSVVNGFAYFKVDHFCLGLLKVITGKAAAYVVKGTGGAFKNVPGASEYVDKLADYIADVSASAVDVGFYAYEWLQNVVADVSCFDWTSANKSVSKGFADAYAAFMERFVLKGSGSDLPQGTLAKAAGDDTNLVKKLNAYRNSNLIDLNNADQFGNVKNIKDCDDLSSEYKLACRQWKVTKYNLDILLADVVLKNLTTDPPRFTFSYNSSESQAIIVDNWSTDKAEIEATVYLKRDDGFLENAAWLLGGLHACADLELAYFPSLTTASRVADELKEYDFQGACKRLYELNSVKSYDLQLSILKNTWDCGNLVYQNEKAREMLQGHEQKLIAISEAMTRVSLLAWMDKNDFRPYSKSAYASIYDGSMSWLRLIGPLMLRNNISAKALTSLVLYEYVHYGTEENLVALNRSFDNHYGTEGGYSEGTGYSQYIWDEATYVLSALKDAHEFKSENLRISKNFMRSAEYMANISRPVCSLRNNSGAQECDSIRYLPVEIDDGCVYEPDYRPWVKLTGDSSYRAIYDVYKMDDNKINPLVAFGISDKEYKGSKKPLPIPARTNPYIWNYFGDGIGLISITNPSTGEVVSLSMIAEEGNLWKMGQAHDQQDNLSITLTSSTKGNIIQDRGYSGFSERQNQKFHRFIYHNVLAPAKSNVILSGNDDTTENVVDINAQNDNRLMEYSDFVERYSAFSDNGPGFVSKLLLLLAGEKKILDDYSNGNIYNFRLEGGNRANLRDSFVVIPDTIEFRNGGGTIAYSASMTYNDDVVPVVENDRTILYFGGSLWVIDRPNEEGMVWLMNSPASYNNLLTEYDGFGVYGLSEFKLGLENLVVNEYGTIPQHDKTVLKNNTYGFRDIETKSYVMHFSTVDSGFVKYVESCPRNCQCFRKNLNNECYYLLIVPNRTASFEICSVLGVECAITKTSTDGILFATMKDNNWDWNIVDGEVYENENGQSIKFGARGGMTNRTTYIFRMKTGKTIEGEYKSSYLPAIPLLLLR